MAYKLCHLLIFKCGTGNKKAYLCNSIDHNTVKLGYNELGYNEHSVITNKFFSPNWSFSYINQPGYNEHFQPVPSCSL